MSSPPEFSASSQSAADWLAGLRGFAARQRLQPSRSQRPIPPAVEQKAEAELIAAHLRAWLMRLPQLLERYSRTGARQPAIAITTSAAGIAAVERLAAEPQLASILAGCCAVTESEYRFWCKEQPDPTYALHLNHWAWVKTRVPAARAAEFAGYPLPAGSHHWLFRHGLAGLGAGDHHSCRLYAWDGTATSLLAESFREGVQGLR